MYTHDARTLGRRHLAVDRCRRFLARLGFARLFDTVLGFAWFADVYPGSDDTPGEGERGRVGRRISPLAAVHGKRWRGRRRQTLRFFEFIAFARPLLRARLYTIFF
jgi:hypothetical protein